MIESEILQYGYLFIAVGTVLEGDATLLAAAFLAHQGYFQVRWVVAVSALTTMLASLGYYLAARRAGDRWLAAVGVQGPKVEKVMGWARSHGGWLVVGSRFMAGFRTVIPIVCGTTGMETMRFFVWNFVGAGLWAIAFGAAGYLGGHVLAGVVADLKRHEKLVAAIIALVTGSLIIWRTHGRDLRDIWFFTRFTFQPPSSRRADN